MKISNNAYNGLNKLTHETKMDCWFWIGTDRNNNDIIRDLENDTKLTWEEGLSELKEGLIYPLSDYNLTDDERTAIKDLYAKYNMVIE